jgi:hypothetical protein
MSQLNLHIRNAQFDFEEEFQDSYGCSTAQFTAGAVASYKFIVASLCKNDVLFTRSALC